MHEVSINTCTEEESIVHSFIMLCKRFSGLEPMTLGHTAITSLLCDSMQYDSFKCLHSLL